MKGKIMSNKRDKSIYVRVSEEEYKKIEKKAEKLSINLSDYIRLVCLNSEINIETKIKK